MRKKVLVVLFSLIAIMALAVTSAGAVKYGELDGDNHPHVVLIIMDVDGAPAYRCSGTMIAPTYVLTAGHCTSNYPDSPYTGMRIFTESDVQNGNNTYPFGGGPNSVEAVRWAAHPLYETAPFFFHDVGMIELAEPFEPGVFGELPAVDSLDQYKTRRGHNDLFFTSVGYGLQWINPVFVEAERVRMVANPQLIQINSALTAHGGASAKFTNNPGTGGGTCFGDSGGPNFLGDTTVVAGVTSFGLNGNCAGTGGVFRTDRQNVQDFIYGFMGQ